MSTVRWKRELGGYYAQDKDVTVQGFLFRSPWRMWAWAVYWSMKGGASSGSMSRVELDFKTAKRNATHCVESIQAEMKRV
jgi:hypothetical protein